jgi:hypothetical protein
VLTAASARGNTPQLVNHPNIVIEAGEDQVHILIAQGAVIEHSLCMYDDRSSFRNWDITELDRLIRLFGTENTLFGSDLGQKNNPLPVEGWDRIVGELLDRGYTTDELRTIAVANPSRLAGSTP